LRHPFFIGASIGKRGLETHRVSTVANFYSSCNPAIQARDLEMLDAICWIKKMQIVDMLPHTHHVENVILLIKNKFEVVSVPVIPCFS